MPRMLHGAVTTTTEVQRARAELAEDSVAVGLGFAAAAPVDLQDFDFMFPTLHEDPGNLLPESPDTPGQLKRLGEAMVDPADEIGTGSDPGDSPIPAAYTYFGQFVDHDTTFEVQPADLPPVAVRRP